MTDFEQIDPNEWDATSYHHISTPQVSWGEKVLDRLTLRGDETVMDAGCGTGRLTALLLERLPRGRVVAVDLSRNMLEEARSHLSQRFGGRVELFSQRRDYQGGNRQHHQGDDHFRRLGFKTLGAVF